MEMYIPDGNGGRKLVNFNGTSAEPAEPEVKLKAQPRAAPAALLADAQATTAIDEVYYPDQDGGRVLIEAGGMTFLPTASASVKGGIMIGAGLSMAGETLNIALTGADIPTATAVSKGGFIPGYGLTMNGDFLNVTLPIGGEYELPTASPFQKGGVKIGNGLAMDGDTLHVTLPSGGGGGVGGSDGCCCGNVYFAGEFNDFPINAPYGWVVFVNRKGYIYNGSRWLPFCQCGCQSSIDTISGGQSSIDTISGGQSSSSYIDDEWNVPIAQRTGNGLNLYVVNGASAAQVGAVSLESGVANIYDSTSGGSLPIASLSSTDNWTDFSVMANNSTDTAFLYDAGTNYKSNFYPEREEAAKNYRTDTELIASNIDNKGNRFDMVVRHKGVKWVKPEVVWDGHVLPSETHYKTEMPTVDILQNGQVVQSFSLSALAATVENDCVDVDPVWHMEWTIDPLEVLSYDPEEFRAAHPELEDADTADWIAAFQNQVRDNFMGTGDLNTMLKWLGCWHGKAATYARPTNAFIENAQAWQFWLEVQCIGETDHDDDVFGGEGHMAFGNVYAKPGVSDSFLSRLYLVTATGAIVVSEASGNIYKTRDADEQEIRTSNRTGIQNATGRVRAPIEDGCYYELYDVFDEYDLGGYGDPYETYNLIYLKHLACVTVFDPTGNALLSSVVHLPASFHACRHKGGYLVSVDTSAKTWMNYVTSADTYNGIQALDKGLYFVADGQHIRVTPNITQGISTRLRPMRDINGWAARIQPLAVQQNEIEFE